MRATTALFAAILLSTPVAVIAQSPPSSSNQHVGVNQSSSDWRDNPRLELLGLLGLGGLLALMRRREPSIHIDARREKRSPEG